MVKHEALKLKKEFEENGYVVLRNFFSSEEIDQLREEIVKAGKKLDKESALNKDNMIFYSNIFYKSPFLQRFLVQENIINLLKVIIGPDFWVRWDQCVAKGAGGSDFPWHQDNAYNQLKDEHFQFWVGITEMTKENGGLWLKKGSHKHGLLPHEYIGSHLSCTEDVGEAEFIAANKGDVVLFSSLLLHHTRKNKTNTSRWAYVIEYMSTDLYDPLVKAPYFIASQDGMPANKFVDSIAGNRKIKNRIKYFGFEANRFKDKCKKAVKSAIGRR